MGNEIDFSSLSLEEIDLYIEELGKERKRREITHLTKTAIESTKKLNKKIDELGSKIVEMREELERVTSERDSVYDYLDHLDEVKKDLQGA